MKYHIQHLALIFLLAVSMSCRKDVKPEGELTPYTFEYPTLFSSYLPAIEQPADNIASEEGVALGRMLFFDTRLSKNEAQSCGSCHSPSASFSDTTAFSVGVDGLPGGRNAMPIINVAWMLDGLFWDGRSSSIENQAYEPVVNPIEMHETWPNAIAKLQADNLYPSLFEQVFGTSIIDSINVSKAIAQFERTLITGNSPFDKFIAGNFAIGSSGWSVANEQLAFEGFTIFMDESKGDCFHCHGDQFNPLWTDNIYHNNGLDASFTDNGLGDITSNPSDNGKFKTPTLRNLAFTAPYMHDGRFNTLNEVIMHYSTGLQNSATIDPLMKQVGSGGVQLTPQEQNSLMWFLLSLSDSSFVNNPAFQNPW